MADPFRKTTADGTVIVFNRETKQWVPEGGATPAVPGRPADSGNPPQVTMGRARGRPQPGPGAGFGANVKAGLVDDPDTKIRFFSKSLGVPVENFNVLNGEIVYLDDQGELTRAEGGSAASVAGDLASGSPEVAGSITGGLLGSAGGPVGTVMGGALGAGAGSALKNIFANTVLDENQSAGGVAAEIGIEAGLDMAFGAAGGKVGSLLTKRAGKRVMSDAAQFNAREVAATIKRIEDVAGIKLDVAQASGLASLRQLRLWAYKFPNQASNIMQANKELQEDQSGAAVERLLGALTEGVDNVVLGKQGINAAEASIKLAKAQRRNATKNLYKTAFDGAEAVNIAPLIEFIDGELPQSVGKKATALKRIRTLLTEGKGKKPVTNLEKLHNVKVELDNMLSNDPANSADALAKGVAGKVRGDLIEIMEDASPVYKLAQSKYRDISQRLVNPLEDGIIGELARVKSPRIAGVLARWFRAGDADPQLIAGARRSVEVTGAKGRVAWRGMMRIHLGRQLDLAAKEHNTGTSVGARFRKLVAGTPRQRAAMQAAFARPSPARVQTPGGAHVGVPEYLDTVLEAFDLIAKAPNAASDTQSLLAIENGIRDAAPLQSFRNARTTAAALVNSIVDDSTDEFVQRNAVAIAEAMSDPFKAARLAQMRQGGLTLKKAATIIGLVGGVTVAEEGVEEGALGFREVAR